MQSKGVLGVNDKKRRRKSIEAERKKRQESVKSMEGMDGIAFFSRL